MGLKSILDVVVNDADFKRFQKLFDGYRESLKDLPGLWDSSTESAGAAAGASTDMAAAVAATAAALHKISQENALVSRQTENQAKSWRDMAKSANTFVHHITDATRSLLRWAGLTGIISGILGVGGLFGIERLASFAGNQRASSFALGVKPGDIKAFETNLGARGFDTNSFLGNVNTGMMDLTSPQFLGLRGALGANFDPRGKEVGDVALQTISALKRQVDAIPLGELFEPTAHARKLDQIMSMEDLQRLRRTPANEVADYAKQISVDRQTFNLPDKTLKAWQNLEAQFTRSATTLKDVVIDKLSALAEPIANLSNAFTKAVGDLLSRPELADWINKLAGGIEWLANYLMSDKFKDQVSTFIEGVDKFGHALLDLTKDLIGIIEGIDNWFHGDKKGSIFNGVNGDVGGSGADTPGSPFSHFVHPDLYHEEDKSWWWHYGGKQAMPDTDEQKKKLQQLENYYSLPKGLLGTVEKIESNNGENVFSPRGAVGPFQFTKEAWQDYGAGGNPFNFNDSAGASARYFDKLLKEFHGDVAEAAAAYNAGPETIEKAIKQFGAEWRRGLPHPEETIPYVDSVVKALGTYKTSSLQPNTGKPTNVQISINNNTGGNTVVAANQLAV
jgi:hypothetical protein